MAEYDLKLVVDADTTEAQRKLDALGGGASGGKGAAPSGTPAGPGTVPTSPEAEAAAKRVRVLRAGLEGKPNLSNNPDDFGRKAGETAGKAIGKAVAGFLAHEVAATIFTGMKTPGGDNRGVNQAEAGVGGALKYGTMGAMLGGPLGAAIGGIGGAIMGIFQERQRQQKAVEARDNAIKYLERSSVRDVVNGASDSAFSRSLELSGGWRQRMEMIRARRNEIEHGEGDVSIDTLKKEIKDADPESDYGKELAQILQTQMGRWSSLARQEIDEGLAVAPGRLDAGSAADSWAKRGVFVGAQVDVAQVNEKIMGEVQGCRALLEKIASMGTSETTTIGNVLKAVYD